jgi:hypothetical protein
LAFASLRLADGRTALSQHRRRSPDKRAHRRVGVFMITSMVAILAITSGAYVALRAHRGGGADPVAIAAAEVRVSHAAAVLERERQHMILMDAASRTMNVESSPKLAAQPAAPVTTTGGTGGTVADEAAPPPPAPDPGTAQSIAYNMLPSFGFDAATQYSCLNDIWSRESGWSYNAENATSGAYGIPQALPGSKMASAGADWATSAATQIKWGLGYIKDRYVTPCDGWAFWEAHGWY